MVRWIRWDCPPDTGFEIRIWSESEHATSRSRRFTTILNHCEWAWKKHFVSHKLEGQSGFRTRDLWLSEQAALTTAPGPLPFKMKGVYRPSRRSCGSGCSVRKLQFVIYKIPVHIQRWPGIAPRLETLCQCLENIIQGFSPFRVQSS